MSSYLLHRRKAFRGGFTYYSQSFDGDNDHATIDTSSLGDGKTLTISFWLKTSTKNQFVFGIGGGNTMVFQVLSSGHLDFRCVDSSSNVDLQLQAQTDFADNAWHHILISFDVAGGGDEFFYVDDVDETVKLATVNDTLDFTGTLSIGSRGDTFGDFTGLISEFILNNNYIDISVAANRAKFISGGKPVDPGSDASTALGETAFIYLPNKVGGSPAWTTNAGDGGNLTNYSTGPSDGGADIP